MARRSNEEISSIKKLIEKIMIEDKETSPSKIEKILKDKYGQTISKQTLSNICSEIDPRIINKDSDLELEYENHPEIIKINERIKKLEKDFDTAESATDRNKYNSALNDTQESKLRLKKAIREVEILKKNSDKAQYIIKFGTPEVISNDNVKKPFFKTDEKQKPLPLVKPEIKDGEE